MRRPCPRRSTSLRNDTFRSSELPSKEEDIREKDPSRPQTNRGDPLPKSKSQVQNPLIPNSNLDRSVPDNHIAKTPSIHHKLLQTRKSASSQPKQSSTSHPKPQKSPPHAHPPSRPLHTRRSAGAPGPRAPCRRGASPPPFRPRARWAFGAERASRGCCCAGRRCV